MRRFTKWLLELHGFVPIISPITEPAVGYGAVVAGVYFIPKKKEEGKGFQMGMDVGWGPDSWAFYIIFGSAWLR